MKRKSFLKSLAVVPVLAHFPLNTFQFFQDEYSLEELIGKKKPALFGDGFLLRKEAFHAFEAMRKAARKEGIEIQVVSSFRSYSHQQSIWERKYTNFTKNGLSPEQAIQKIIEYSTIPGTSRHHWGTDLDIIDANVSAPENVLLPKHFEDDGVYCKLNEWTKANAEKFGFYLAYTPTPTRKGFKHEPWHFSFAELSIPMLKEYRKVNIASILRKEKLLGSQYFSEKFITQYTQENILDIHPILLG